MADRASPTSELVGRSTDIARVVRWFDTDGPPTLIVEGPPGLGKTTVWRAAIDALEERGIRTLTCAPAEAESGLSYSGLADLLAPDAEVWRSQLPPPQARALAIALRLEDPGPEPADETAVARGALAAVRALATHDGPVLIAIDDLRWLDAPSLAAVVYVTRRLEAPDGVRILATHRTGAPEPDALASGDAVQRMALGPMSVGGIHRIVRLHAGITLPRPRLLEIHDATGGNPLHAIELARSMESGLTAADDSLASLFGARIAALPRHAGEALALVAASADRSTARLAAAWDAWPRNGPNSPFANAIAPVVAAGLVSLPGRQVRPAHPLVTHVAYESADASVRRAAHQALAATTDDAEERALHLGRSVDGVDAAVADKLEATARSDRARGIRALRADLFERAAVLTPPREREAAGRRWLAAAAAWFEAGDTHRVERLLEPMIDTWPAGSQRAEARWRLGIALDEAGRWPEATRLWGDALDDTDDPAIRSQIRCSLSITAMYTDTTAAAIAWGGAAVEDADASGSPAALARSLAVHAFILAMAGRPEGAAVMDRALALEATIDEHLGEWSPAALAAECARHAGDIGSAIRHYETVLDRAASRGDAGVEQWAAFGLASAEILAGDIERASVLADLVLDIGEQTDIMRIPARSLRAHVDACQGRIAQARAMLEEAMAMARVADEATHQFGGQLVLGAIETCAGNPAAAATALREARALAQRLGLAHASVLRAALLEVEVAAAAGDLAHADDALTAFDRMVGAPMPPWLVPLRRRAVGTTLAARGELEAAVPELEAAAADEAALPPDVGRALLALAATLRRLRRYRRSRATAERARSLFAELGLVPFAAAAEREAARSPGRRTSDDGELSPAESRIAELVAAGRTNRDVAAELVLSVKTVEVTLTRVYQKLGVRSRAELAAQVRDGEGPKV